MRRAHWTLLGLLLLVPACDATLCPTDRLTPPAATPSWAVRFNELPAFEMPPDIPGEEQLFDPPGTETYASFSLYDVGGALIAERWLDGLTRWEAATGTVTAAARFASASAPGRMTLLLADGRRPSVTFSLSDGSVGLEVPASAAPPLVAGQLADWLAIDERLALATRRRSPEGGGDLLVVDPQEGVVLRRLDLSRLSTGPVEPGRIAALEGDRYVVGMTLTAEPTMGAVALVDLSTDAVTRLSVQGLTDCWEAASLPPTGTTGRAAVLCRGDLTAPGDQRTGMGFAIIDAAPDDTPTLTLSRVGDATLSRNPPTGRLVGLDGAWVAVRSAGDTTVGRLDALLAIDLEGESAEVLSQAPYSDRWGAPLGDGDFGGGELWWPSVTGGILRWRMEGIGSAATFTALAEAMLPGCEATPPRDIRYLPAP